MPLGDLLDSPAREAGETAAIVCDDSAICYHELSRRTTALALWLQKEGLRPEDRVAVHWANSVELVTVCFACFKAGLIAVPVNIRLKPPEVEYVLRHSGASICFTQAGLEAVTEKAIAFGDLSTRLHCGLPDTANHTGTLPPISDSDPAAILYTSGSTAHPKGVVHTHGSLSETARLTLVMMDGAGTIGMPTTQVSHTSGLCLLLANVAAHQTSVLLPAFDPAAALDAIARYGVTCVFTLPAMLALMADRQELQPRNIGSLRALFAGGDSIPLTLQERARVLFGLPVLEVMGMTEACPALWNTAQNLRPGSVGKPGMEVKIEPRGMEESTVGELLFRGASVCKGYWRDPETTAMALRDGWLHTGDLVHQDEDGYIWFEGRLKQIIIRGGSNISPQEVEAVLYLHPSVAQAGAIGFPDETLGQTVAAYVSIREGDIVSEQELRDFARERMADYKVPEHIWILPELPKGLTGKIDRRALAEMSLRKTATA
jgi:long-chain acyl-CoA synthetase